MSIKIPLPGLMSQNPGCNAQYKWGNGSRRLVWLALAWLFVFLVSPVFINARVCAGEQMQIEVIKRVDQLPAGVRRMHRAILQAAMSGEIERMSEVLQMNELMPLIDGKVFHDPVEHWKNTSIDQTGRETLAVLTEILELPPVKTTSKVGVLYVWPYFAEVPLDRLAGGELIQLTRLAPAKKTAVWLKNNHYSHFRVEIGPDGTWHSFGRSPLQPAIKMPRKQ